MALLKEQRKLADELGNDFNAKRALEKLAPFIGDCLDQIGSLCIQDYEALNEGLIMCETAGIKMPRKKNNRK